MTISASLATVGLLGPLPSAFGYSVEPQTNTKQAQRLEDVSGSIRGASGEWTQNQGLVQKDQATESMLFLPVAVAPQTAESSQPNLAEKTDPVTSVIVKIFVTFAFISGGFLWVIQDNNYKKKRTKHVTDILKEIESLERIRKMKPDIYQSISPLRKKPTDTLKKIEKMKR